MSRTPLVVLGLGVIGGSLARALRDDPAWQIITWAASEEDRRDAVRERIVVASSLAAAASDAGPGIVVIAVPLNYVAEVAREALRAAPDALVLHTASLQMPDAVHLAPADLERVFGTHPIAGSHAAGFAASRADLFRGAAVSIEPRLAEQDRQRAVALWRAAGAARVDVRDAAAHDALMAWVSHLPQLAAIALASALDASGTPPSAGGPGARDTTRLARSTLAMWRPILDRAPTETVVALRALRDAITDLERAIVEHDGARLERRWSAAARWRAAATGESA